MAEPLSTEDTEFKTIQQESADLAREVHRESDRAAVVVGAAFLDSLLERLLLRTLRPHAAGPDPLFDGDAPLSTFSSRINLSHRLGLIDDELARALHLIRRIRNDFAHNPAECDLNTSPHRDRVRELANPIKNDPYFIKWRASFLTDSRSDASLHFRGMLFVIFSRLQYACIAAKLNSRA